jgi:hypothetical protein
MIKQKTNKDGGTTTTGERSKKERQERQERKATKGQNEQRGKPSTKRERGEHDART